MKLVLSAFLTGSLACLLASSGALAAQPQVTASWSNNGQYLLVQVKDSAVEGGTNPAGQLWLAMAGNQGDKEVQTHHLDLTCVGQLLADGTPSANCSLWLAKSQMNQLDDGSYVYMISGAEGQQALAGIKAFSEDETFNLAPQGNLQVELNTRINALAVYVDHSLVSAN